VRHEAWSGGEWHREARRRRAGMIRRDQFRLRGAGLGGDRLDRAWHPKARNGLAGRAGLVVVWHGKARLGWAGRAWEGTAPLGGVGQAWKLPDVGKFGSGRVSAVKPFRLTAFRATNEKSLGWNRGSTVSVNPANGCAQEWEGPSPFQHTSCRNVKVCPNDHPIFTQPSRGAAPPSADPAVDPAAATAWVPGAERGLDGAVSARFSIGGR